MSQKRSHNPRAWNKWHRSSQTSRCGGRRERAKAAKGTSPLPLQQKILWEDGLSWDTPTNIHNWLSMGKISKEPTSAYTLVAAPVLLSQCDVTETSLNTYIAKLDRTWSLCLSPWLVSPSRTRPSTLKAPFGLKFVRCINKPRTSGSVEPCASDIVR